MNKEQSEQMRLEQTLSMANGQLTKLRNLNEDNKAAILEAKKELRENTVHSFTNLYSSDDFEALAELNQYVNPVTDKIADYDAVERKIQLLEELLKSPYFARVDFTFEGEAEAEPIYIGKTSLKKDNSYDMFVYDWRSPIASLFYRFVTGAAYYDAPNGRIGGEISLKRQYEIRDGVLQFFFDADIQIVDEFLRQLLSKNQSPKMKTIVESIQKEQDIIIRDMENDLMMVQGVAGSGKTSIALHRAAYLMYDGLSSRLKANNIIIISPNHVFEQYISNVLPELGEENVQSMVFDEMVQTILQHKRIQTKNQFLEHLITDCEVKEFRKNSIAYKTSLSFQKVLDRFVEDLPMRFLEFEDVIYQGKRVLGKATLKKKIEGRKEVPLGIKLKQLEEFIIESISGYKKTKLTMKQEQQIKQDITSFTELDLFALYLELWKDASYLAQFAGGNEEQKLQAELCHDTLENLKAGILPYEDGIVLAYLHLKIFGSQNYKNIKQVVIDEAQDYYPLQFEIFHMLFANSKFTVLGDINQTLEKLEDLTLYDQVRTILQKKRSTLVTMDKSFRCTNEILRYSAKFLNSNQDIKSFNRNGEEPGVYTYAEQNAWIEGIKLELARCKEAGYQSVGLLCKTKYNTLTLHRALKKQTQLELIEEESAAELHGVFAIPIYLSKGLEFDAVLICDADGATYESEDDKKLLYIASTRALHRLNLFCVGEASPLLS